MARTLLDAAGVTVRRACFGLPGPVRGARIALTNLPWVIDRAALRAALGVSALRLLNDFEALGHGLALLGPADLVTLQEGRPQPHGPRAVLGAGTGLGQALLVWAEGGWRVLPGEGGHTSFAPQNPQEYRLHAFLAERHGHVSWERLLSGPGLAAIHAFLCAEAGVAPGGAQTAEDPAAAVADRADRDPLCAGALDLFVRLYGAEAGNLALKCLPRGGLFVAGGIAPKLLPRLRAGGFLEGFLAKGRMRGLLAELPVHVVIQPQVGLLGAAACAAREVVAEP